MKIIFELIEKKRKEFVLFSTLLVGTSIILYLFDVRFEVFLVMALVFLLAFFYYLIVSISDFRKEKNLKLEIGKLKKELRKETESKIAYRNELKDYFLIWIHQVKTPITSLNLLAESLEEEEGERLKIISMSIESYTEMALTYLKLIDFSADMNIKKVQLSSIVKKLLRKYSRHFISSSTKLIYEDFQEEVISDRNYLEIMIEQILNNALKYASGKEIYIGFREDYLYIRDTGLGIASDDIKKIFSQGYSVSNEINPNKSSGIGLYIVKRISDKLNHPVEARSEIGKFTEFRIYFFESYKDVR